MLRRSFDNMLPATIWRRRKQGFGVPIHKWFRAQLGAELENLLSQTSTCLDKSRVTHLLNEHRRGLRDHGYRLWGIYVYLLCKQRHLSQ